MCCDSFQVCENLYRKLLRRRLQNLETKSAKIELLLSYCFEFHCNIFGIIVFYNFKKDNLKIDIG